jgi:hypothetical protein
MANQMITPNQQDLYTPKTIPQCRETQNYVLGAHGEFINFEKNHIYKKGKK